MAAQLKAARAEAAKAAVREAVVTADSRQRTTADGRPRSSASVRVENAHIAVGTPGGVSEGRVDKIGGGEGWHMALLMAVRVWCRCR